MSLFNTQAADTALVWHQGEAVTRASFAHAALQLRDRFEHSPVTHYINVCDSRLAFMLGLVAVALLERQTLLPASQNEAALQRLQTQYPRHQLIDDNVLHDLNWREHTAAALRLNPEAIMAILHTSGSTGTPQAHAKTWDQLERTGELDCARFTGNAAINLVATVPSQHMFGLQTTVLLPLCGAAAIYDARPFFPADIRAALHAVPAPRALITTPTHLRACVAAGLDLPALQFILCATAPMPLELAQAAEAAWHAPVLEIYGSTEAGTMATRRTTQGDVWQLLPGAQLLTQHEQTFFHAPHLPEPLLLSDHLEPSSPTQFRLLGRASDQIKVAGKRISLSELTHALAGIAGVIDAVVFLPDGSERTAALVVAPHAEAAQLLEALRSQVDAVFLPRPLILVDRLPRNEVGKLTRAALHAALQQHRSP